MFKGFSNSVKGASHEQSGLVCQDSSAHFVGEYYAVAVVADGHGSKKHFRSNMGSKFAVEATLDTIANFYEDVETFEKTFPLNHKFVIKRINKQIIANWNSKVEEHLKSNPVTAEEKSKFSYDEFEQIPPESYYGTTLIACIAPRNSCARRSFSRRRVIFFSRSAIRPLSSARSSTAFTAKSLLPNCTPVYRS